MPEKGMVSAETLQVGQKICVVQLHRRTRLHSKYGCIRVLVATTADLWLLRDALAPAIRFRVRVLKVRGLW
jgi:hypothetical protein